MSPGADHPSLSVKMRPVPSSMPRRLRLLHAIHDFLPRHQAGSEIYAATLCQALMRRGHHVTVLAAVFDPARRHGDLIWRVFEGLPVVEIVNNWEFRSFGETYRAPNLLPVLDHVLRATQPDVLHVHNLLNLSFDLPRQARARGARVVGTLHDYTLVCPSGGQRIHRAERHVCHRIEPDRCARCFAESSYPRQMAFGRALGRPGGSLAHRLARTLRRRTPRLLARLATSRRLTATAHDPTAADIEARLDAARAVATDVDLLVGPVAVDRREFSALGIAPKRLEVADYGFQPIRRSTAPASTSTGREPLRVGYVGTLVWHKGVHVLIDAMRQVPPGQVDALIFGDADTFPEYTAELRASAQGLPVRFMGRFARERVADVYSPVRRPRRAVVVARELAARHPRGVHGRRAGDRSQARGHQRSRSRGRERPPLPGRILDGARRDAERPGERSFATHRAARAPPRQSRRLTKTPRSGNADTCP